MINPLVSICIPTYNGQQFIAEAMDSAIAQTYENLEIIVSDDNSKDETLRIIKSYKDITNIPIKIYRHEPNGIGANWNNCIENANGEFIKFLFQDDILYPNCVRRMVSVLLKNESLTILSCKRNFIVEDSFKVDGYLKWISLYEDLQKDLSLEYKNNLAFLNVTFFRNETFLNSPLNKVGEPTTILFRKNLTDSIGSFSTDLKQILDYEFCYRVLPFSKIGILNEHLVQFRLHDRQTTVKNKIGSIYENDFIKYLNILYRHYYKYLKPELKKKLLRLHNPIVALIYNVVDFIKKILTTS